MPHQTQVHKLLHLAPGLHVVLVDVGLGVRAAGGYITMRRMKVREWPVHQIEVEVLHAKVKKRLATRIDDIVFMVLVVPQLGSNPNLFALDTALNNRFERNSDFGFISRSEEHTSELQSP